VPQNFYLVMKGTTQGKLKAGTPKKAKPGTIDFLQVYLNHKVFPGVLSDAVSGTPNQKAFTIGRQSNLASAQLLDGSVNTQSFRVPNPGFGWNPSKGSSSGTGSGTGSGSKPPFNPGKKTNTSSTQLMQSAVNTQSVRIPNGGFGWNPSKSSSSGTGSGSGSGSPPPFNPSRMTDSSSTSLFQNCATGESSNTQPFKIPNPGLGSNPFKNAGSGKGSGGAGSGSQQHSPITIRRGVDAASPLFFQFLANSEVFGNVAIQFDGAGGVTYSLLLTNASIVSIRRVVDAAAQCPCEDVEFAYSTRRIALSRDALLV
jgi:type VI protein secretion system component Hcp